MWRTNLEWAAVCLTAASIWPSVQASQQPQAASATSNAAAPDATRRLSRWVHDSGDHRGLPYAIVDKRLALITLYSPDGTVAGSSSALMGRTLGDASVAGVGERTQQQRLRSEDLTTPAGRFVSEPGRNTTGEAIVWIDYDSALAIHRLRPGPSRQARARRLASSDAQAKRVSAGCVVVPERFYDAVVQPLLGRGPGVVYVLPESGILPSDTFAVPATNSQAGGRPVPQRIGS